MSVRIWTDVRDGRAWEVRNSAPQAMAGRLDGPVPPGENTVELIHFRHPPKPRSQAGGAAHNPEGRRVEDLSDAELEALLDEALRKAAGG